jgi:catechol 1,2-dioxygenase
MRLLKIGCARLFLVSGPWVSGFRFPVFGIRYSVFGIRFSVFGFRFSVFGFRFSVFGFRFSVFGSRFSGYGQDMGYTLLPVLGPGDRSWVMGPQEYNAGVYSTVHIMSFAISNRVRHNSSCNANLTEEALEYSKNNNGLSRRRLLQVCAGTFVGLGGAAACGPLPAELPAPSQPDAGSGAPDSQIPEGQLVAADSAPSVDSALATECKPTGSDVLGPFHVEGAPFRTQIAEETEIGDLLDIDGVVFGPDCKTPLKDAIVDVWHADDRGIYHDASSAFRLRGQMKTDSEGRYGFSSIRPGHYPLGDSLRPRHVHFIISYPGYAPLTTQLYFAGDPYLQPNDPCGTGCKSGDPTHIVALEQADSGDRQSYKGFFKIVLSKA